MLKRVEQKLLWFSQLFLKGCGDHVGVDSLFRKPWLWTPLTPVSLQNGSRPGRTRRRRKNINNKIDKQREELDEMMGVDGSNGNKLPCSILLMYFDVLSKLPYKWKVEAISRACTPRRPMLLLEVHFVEIWVAHFSKLSSSSPVIQVWISKGEKWRLLGEQWLPYAQALIFFPINPFDIRIHETEWCLLWKISQHVTNFLCSNFCRVLVSV